MVLEGGKYSTSHVGGLPAEHRACLLCSQSKDLQLDIIPASAPGSEVKLRDAAHELNEEKRKSARRKE